MDTVLEFHAEAPQAPVSEGFAQGPYVVARAGFEPMTLRRKATNLPVSPQRYYYYYSIYYYCICSKVSVGLIY